MRRDARGRFRKQTDEERWPDSRERERFTRIVSYFNDSQDAFMCLRLIAQRDVSFYSGEIWP